MRRWSWIAVVAYVVGCSSPAQPGVAQPSPSPAPAPVPVPAALPTIGPECTRGCPDTAPLYPTESCRDGIHLGGRGPCVRFSDGRCNWSRLVCPAASTLTCLPTDCDLPTPSEWLCPDG